MAYLVIALVFLLAGFLFNIASAIWASLEQFTFAIITLILSSCSYVASIGFGLTWIVWLIRVI